MNPFKVCTGQSIRLPSDDEQDDAQEYNRSCCFSLNWPWSSRPGIQLPLDRDLLEDYLDPNSTVGIEPLLENSNEQDHDDDDDNYDGDFMQHNIFNEPQRFLTRNPFATTDTNESPHTNHFTQDFLTGYEDAQFLSDHRISAVVNDTPKGESHSNVFAEGLSQELVDVSRDSMNKWADEPDWTETAAQDSPRQDSFVNSQPDHTDSQKGPDVEAYELNANDTETEPSASNAASQLPAALLDLDIERLDREEKQIKNEEEQRLDAGHRAEQSIDSPSTATDAVTEPPKKEDSTLEKPEAGPSSNGFPMLGLPRVSVSTPTNMSARSGISVDGFVHPPQYIRKEPPSPQLSIENRDIRPSHIPAEPADRSNKRRSSVAAVAQSILGDKLDDFTEKLAYIKKNIIMSLDDDDDEGWDDDYEPDRRQKESAMKGLSATRSSSLDPLIPAMSGSRSTPAARPPARHKRSSSLMDVAPSIAKFLNQVSSHGEDGRIFSPPSFFASLAGPDPAGAAANRKDRTYPRASALPPPLPENDYEGSDTENNNDEEEDLFDFSKVIAMGKNMRSLGEDVMGSGLRIFNDVANRVRNANKQQPSESEGWALDRDAWL